MGNDEGVGRVDLRLTIGAWTRLGAAIRASLGFLMALAGLGLAIQGFEGLDSPSGGDVTDVLKVIAGIPAIPFALWVGTSALRAAFTRRPRVELHPGDLRIVHSGIFRKPVAIPWEDIAAVWFDVRAARLRRLREHRRFELGGSLEGAPGWLFSRVGGAPFPILSHSRVEVPNAAMAFVRPLRLGATRRWMKFLPAQATIHPPVHNRRARGLLFRFKDPEVALTAFESRGLVRAITPDDLQEVRPSSEDRHRARRLVLLDNVLVVGIFVVLLGAPILFEEDFQRSFMGPGVGVCRQMNQEIESNPPPATEAQAPALLDQLVPSDLASAGYVLLEGGAVHPGGDDPFGERLRDAGFIRGYYSRWASPGGEILIQILELGGREQAESFAAGALGDICSDAGEAFAVPEVPGGVGLRWYSTRGLLDQVTFRRDEYYVFAATASKTGEPDRALAVSIAGKLASGL